MIFKIFTVSALIVMLIFIILREFNVRITKLIFTFVVLCGIAFVISPDALTVAANMVGIGRGADLVLYLLCLCFTATLLAAYHRFRVMDERFTALVRSIAIESAVEPEGAQDRQLDTTKK